MKNGTENVGEKQRARRKDRREVDSRVAAVLMRCSERELVEMNNGFEGLVCAYREVFGLVSHQIAAAHFRVRQALEKKQREGTEGKLKSKI